MWVGITTPLCFLGAYYGYKKRPIEHPGTIVRFWTPLQLIAFSPNQSHPAPCSRTSVLHATHSGYYNGRHSTVWLHFYPTLFHSQLHLVASNLLHVWLPFTRFVSSHLTLKLTLIKVAVILIITCSETTILLCYFHLAAEDYNWWWRSFMTSGFTAIYFFIYAAHYYSSKVFRLHFILVI